MTSLRYAIRSLARRPGFSAAVVATLGLGIGVNAAVFTAVHGLLLRPLPFPEGDRLVHLETESSGTSGRLSTREVRELARSATLVEDVAAYYRTQYNLTGDGPPEALGSVVATHNLFAVLGVPMQYGSSWSAADDWTLQYRVAVGHGLWARRYASEPALAGRTVVLDGAGYTVDGVLPRGFEFPARVELFRAVTDFNREETRRFSAVARLRPGATVQHLQAELGRLSETFAAAWPATNAGVRLTAQPLRDLFVGDLRPYLLLLAAAVALVLLVACANVGNLQLARAIERRQELAVRVALGAGRRHIAALLLAEGTVLAVASGALGLVFAWWCVGAVHRLVALDLPSWMIVEVGAPAVGFTLAAAAIAGLAIGLLPALRATSADAALRGSRGSVGTPGQRRAGGTLVACQVALSIVLLVASALLLKSLWRLSQVELGFDPSGLLTFRADPPWSGYPGIEEISTFYERAGDRLASLPGVAAVAASQTLPQSALREISRTVTLEGELPDAARQRPFVSLHVVSPSYHRTLGIPLRSGRLLTEHDREHTLPVGLLSEGAARRFWPGEDPLGRRVHVTLGTRGSGPDTTRDVWVTVVGIVGDVRADAPHLPPGLDLYVSNRQAYAGDTFFVLRTSIEPSSLRPAVGAAVREIDPDQSIFDVRTMGERLAGRTWEARATGAIMTVLACIALLVASLGVYAVVSQAVVRRTREIGVRLALGAQTGNVAGLVFRQGMGPVILGAAAGLGLALLTGRWLDRLLFGVTPIDPVVLGSVTALLVAAAAGACYLPARRAVQLDPVVALRGE